MAIEFVKNNSEILDFEDNILWKFELKTKNLLVFEQIFLVGGSDGFRTRDLGLDRAAC
jgi:hypothetical protein